MSPTATPATAWLDGARFAATLAVLVIHVVAPPLFQFGGSFPLRFNFFNLADSICRFAVPFFLMITGALLLGKDTPILVFLQRRYTRILIPFAFWSVVYAAWSHLRRDAATSPDFLPYLARALTDGAAYHLWYIYLLSGLYLVIPILARWVSQPGTDLLRYYLIVWAIGLLVGGTGIRVNANFDLTVFSGYAGYLVLGHVLATARIPLSNRLVVLLFVGAVVVTFAAVWLGSVSRGRLHGEPYGDLTPNVAIASAALFLLFRRHFQVSHVWLGRIQTLNRASFGVYLIHLLILDLLSLIGLDGNTFHPLFGVPVTVLACYLISTTAILILSRLPLLGRVVQ
jgi:surface polysaccharide O-acyltransferase-like enzyme